jgi:hypothetical protein
MHYERRRKHGSFDPVFQKRKQRKTDPKKFKSNYVVDAKTGCWMWIGGVESHGYGRMSFNGKRYKAHQLSWILNRGEIPKGMCVCHHCDTPGCVNPDHLFLGTMADNMRDKVAKGRQSHKGYNNREEYLEKCRRVAEMKDESACTIKNISEIFQEPQGTIAWRISQWRKYSRESVNTEQRFIHGL